MNLRFSPLRAMLTQEDMGRFTASAVLTLALAGVGIGNALAAPGDAASAPDAASVSYAAGGQYTVRPGQSLNDVAIAVTQSHDRATLVRASRALFDANPNAFMSHDPSRMRVGAVLTVPVLDASGALAASSAAVAGSAPVAASAADSGANAAAVVGAASGVAQVNAAAASAASAAARATEPATPAVTGAASAAAEANPATPGSAAVAGAASSAPVAGSQAAASPASGAHVWSGSVQPSASESAGAQPASQARTQVSSLQQLLALKNRVLMELQKHGIGGSPAASSAVSNGAQPAAGVSSATVAPAHGGAAATPSNEGALSQTNLSVAAAVGAALVVLLGALRLRRKKREKLVDEAASTEIEAMDPQQAASAREQMPVHDASAPTDAAVAIQHTAALETAEREAAEREVASRETAERVAAEREAEIRRAAEQEAAEHEAAARDTAERVAAEREAEIRRAAEREAAEGEAAARDTAERVAAEREAEIRRATVHEAEEREAAHQAAPEQAAAALPKQATSAPRDPWQDSPAAPAPFAPLQLNTEVAPAAQSDVAPEAAAPSHHEELSSATTAASLAAAAELGAEALPLTPLEPVSESVQPEEQHHGLQWDDAPASSAPIAPPPAIDFTEPHFESHTASPFGQPHAETPAHPAPVTHAQPTPTVPGEFPRDAVDAFGSLDMPLPPRVESAADAPDVPVSLGTQPVMSPEATAQQALAPHDPDDDPHIADEIAAGTAGHAAIAGLGAAGFGALKLDFDLELPPSPAQPLPAFTQIDLSRIARNKLELASEYIDLGDLSGARTLINEVIEVNDPGTRTEARALLSTLAPLS